MPRSKTSSESSETSSDDVANAGSVAHDAVESNVVVLGHEDREDSDSQVVKPDALCVNKDSIFEGDDDYDDGRRQSEDSVSFSSGRNKENLAGKRVRLNPYDNPWIRRTKMLVFFVLFVVALVAAYWIYVSSIREEEKEYELLFNDVASTILKGMEINAVKAVSTYEALAMTVTSHASTTDYSWPLVTVPQWEYHAQRVMEATGSTSVGLSLFVSPEDRPQYETHRRENTPKWTNETLSFLQLGEDDAPLPFVPPILPQISRIIDFRTGASEPMGEPATANGLYLPTAQISPISLSFFVNNDGMADPYGRLLFSAAAQSKSTVFSNAFNLDGNNSLPLTYIASPVMNVAVPGGAKNSKTESVGIIAGSVAWDVFIGNLAPDEVSLIYLVIKNSCNQTFTYALEDGTVDYLGEGDLHERILDKRMSGTIAPLEVATDFTPFGDADICRYSVHAFPSQQFYDDSHTDRAIVNTIAVVATFLLTAIVIFLYDYLVQRWQDKVVEKATRSDAIINSLFPENVRDRLMEQNNSNDRTDSDMNGKSSSHTGGKYGGQGAKGVIGTVQQKLRGNGNGNSNVVGAESRVLSALRSGNVDRTPGSKPIADLFPSASVLFADLVGFTAWSSTRQPEEVFTLLEALYGAFDRTAQRMRVFKVETIGDCYVAACGLPHPEPQHAVVLTRFAKMCLTKVSAVLDELALTLGPTTRDLSMRVGIHSGPVTGGVLRGDKSRFQLFGDTVNTASRMESTGASGRIHVSSQTAQELQSYGKVAWIEARSDKVVAKGKGELQTFWVVTGRTGRDGRSSVSVSGQSVANETAGGRMASAGAGAAGAGAAGQRVGSGSKAPNSASNDAETEILWVTDVLRSALEKVVSARNSKGGALPSVSDTHWASVTEKQSNDGTTVISEVRQAIEFSSSVADAGNESSAGRSTARLSVDVVDQLEAFVREIESMYRSNPFHSFSHAVHVIQSTTKMLARISVPPQQSASRSKSISSSTNRATVVRQMACAMATDPLTQLSCLFAALIHDVDHQGVSNMQLVNEGTRLAQMYNNKSVAEQNSLDMSWDVLTDRRFDALRLCIASNEGELRQFRQLLVNAVMATDIFDKELNAARKARWHQVFDTATVDDQQQQQQLLDSGANGNSNSNSNSSNSNNSSVPHSDSLSTQASEMATVIIENLLRASDVSHTMQHWHVYRKWNECLFHEMYKAYKDGRAQTDPSEKWYEGEMWFFDNYILSLAKKLKSSGMFGVSSDEYLTYAMSNREEWKARGREAVQEYLSSYDAGMGAVGN